MLTGKFWTGNWKNSNRSTMKSWNPYENVLLNNELFSKGGLEKWCIKAPLQLCSFDSVALQTENSLLGDCVDCLCEVSHIPRGHACHGNSTVLGHVHRKLLSQPLNLQAQNNMHQVKFLKHPLPLGFLQKPATLFYYFILVRQGNL